jgi:hypothetical protein
MRRRRRPTWRVDTAGAGAITGGLPAMRNRRDIGDILNQVYRGLDGAQSHVPNDPELPLLFDKVYPVNEIVRVDYFIPGCPPVRRRDLEISERSNSGAHVASRSQSPALRLRADSGCNPRRRCRYKITRSSASLADVRPRYHHRGSVQLPFM